MADHTVLFVDDEPNILSTLRRLCRRENYKVVTAGSGPEALQLLRETPAQVILSDYRMPEMTGVEFLSRAKEIVPDSVRIILSGFADTQAVVEAINMGEVYRFLGKPWDDCELLTTIRRGIEHHVLCRENRELQDRLQQQNSQLQTMLEQMEDLVFERTFSLMLSQDVLEQMPVGVLGVSNDGEVMLSNAHFLNNLVDQKIIVPGTVIEEVLPGAIAAKVHECLVSRSDQTFACPMRGYPVVLTITNLRSAGQQRGCVLTFHRQERFCHV